MSITKEIQIVYINNIYQIVAFIKVFNVFGDFLFFFVKTIDLFLEFVYNNYRSLIRTYC